MDSHGPERAHLYTGPVKVFLLLSLVVYHSNETGRAARRAGWSSTASSAARRPSLAFNISLQAAARGLLEPLDSIPARPGPRLFCHVLKMSSSGQERKNFDRAYVSAIFPGPEVFIEASGDRPPRGVRPSGPRRSARPGQLRRRVGLP